MIITDVLPVCQEYGDILVKMYLAIGSSVSSKHFYKKTIVFLTLHQKYYAKKLLYQHFTYSSA